MTTYFVSQTAAIYGAELQRLDALDDEPRVSSLRDLRRNLGRRESDGELLEIGREFQSTGSAEFSNDERLLVKLRPEARNR